MSLFEHNPKRFEVAQHETLSASQKISIFFILFMVIGLPVLISSTFSKINSRTSGASQQDQYTNNPTQQKDTGFGKAIKFTNDNTTPPSFVQVSSSEFLEFPQNFQTIEFWFNVDFLSPWPYGQDLIRQNKTDNSKTTWTVNVDPSGYVRYHVDSGSVFGLDSLTTITPGQWYHLAISKKEGVVSMYLNGFLEDTDTFTEATPTWDSNLGIGGGQATDLIYFKNLNGQIDELRISNIGRYNEEFTPSRQPFLPDENTILLYHFDDNLENFNGVGSGVAIGNFDFVNSTISYVRNSTPEITTISLRPAKVGDLYQESATAQDFDGNIMKMKISGLPETINTSSCREKIIQKTTSVIGCAIVGQFLSEGSYLVTIEVDDGNGGKNTKEFTIHVSP